MLLSISDERGNVVGGEQRIREDLGLGEWQVRDGVCAEGNLLQVGREQGGHCSMSLSSPLSILMPCPKPGEMLYIKEDLSRVPDDEDEPPLVKLQA